jgi:hypothetical protein
VQHIKIYLPCNFEVNPITHFGVISLFVDLDMLSMFAVSTYHLFVIVFEIKDEKY